MFSPSGECASNILEIEPAGPDDRPVIRGAVNEGVAGNAYRRDLGYKLEFANDSV